MNLTNEFCRKQVAMGVARVRYVKQAVECLGKQPGSRIWVINVQLKEDGERIPICDSEYVRLGSNISNRILTNVAPAADAADIPLTSSPLNAFDDTLASLKLLWTTTMSQL